MIYIKGSNIVISIMLTMVFVCNGCTSNEPPKDAGKNGEPENHSDAISILSLYVEEEYNGTVAQEDRDDNDLCHISIFHA